MINKLSNKAVRKKFKKTFYEEFDDANEAFMDYMLELIPKNILIKVLNKGRQSYYSRFYKKNNERKK